MHLPVVRTAMRLTRISNLAPVIRVLLVVQMTDPGDMRRVTVFPRPFDRLELRVARGQRMIRMVLDDIVRNQTSFRPALGASLDIDNRHLGFP